MTALEFSRLRMLVEAGAKQKPCVANQYPFDIIQSIVLLTVFLRAL